MQNIGKKLACAALVFSFIASPCMALADASDINTVDVSSSVSDVAMNNSEDIVDTSNQINSPVDGEYSSGNAEGNNGGETVLLVKGPDGEEEKENSPVDEEKKPESNSAPGGAAGSGGGSTSHDPLPKTFDLIVYMFPLGVLLAGEICIYISLSHKNAQDIEDEVSVTDMV